MSNTFKVILDDARLDIALRFMPFLMGTLRAGGTQFPNMRCNVPACDPARFGFLTGQWAKGAANGVYQNNSDDITAPTVDSLPVWLGDASVQTGIFGKYPGSTSTPWDQKGIVDSLNPHGYGVYNGTTTTTPATHQLTYIAGLVETFVTTATQPWFCWWTPTAPHVNAGDKSFTFNPLPATASRFQWAQHPVVKLDDANAANKPTWIAALPQFNAIAWSTLNTVARQMAREAFDVDQALAVIFASLVSAGRLADTTIIVTSDSGVFLGEQRLGNLLGSTKDHPYDCVAKVPCVVYGPGFPAGSTNLTPTTLQDLTSTVLDIHNASPTVTQHGASLLTLNDLDRATLWERQGDATYPDGNAVVTIDRKLMKWTGETGSDQYEAYDLDTDPDELVNWANDSGRSAERATLEAQRAALAA